MAIRMMTNKDNADQDTVEIVEDYPGHEVTTVCHYDCPTHKASGDRYSYHEHRGSIREDCTDKCKHMDPLYMKTTNVGCVLSTYEANGYDDSDFYAVVWNEAAQTVQHIQYATTRGWSYPNGASADATEEVREKAAEYMYNSQVDSSIATAYEKAEKQAREVTKGAVVKVERGRKVPKGVEGSVFWIGNGSYGSRCGIRVSNAEQFPDHEFDTCKTTGDPIAWTATSNVDPKGWQDSIEVNEEEVRERTRRWAFNFSWLRSR